MKVLLNIADVSTSCSLQTTYKQGSMSNYWAELGPYCQTFNGESGTVIGHSFLKANTQFLCDYIKNRNKSNGAQQSIQAPKVKDEALVPLPVAGFIMNNANGILLIIQRPDYYPN